MYLFTNFIYLIYLFNSLLSFYITNRLFKLRFAKIKKVTIIIENYQFENFSFHVCRITHIVIIDRFTSLETICVLLSNAKFLSRRNKEPRRHVLHPLLPRKNDGTNLGELHSLEA